MEKVLGLDLGTNSIGWAIVNHHEDGSYSLVDQGVNIFKEGVAYEKGSEKPAVQERTAARASRRHYFRRRLRKIELLKVLVSEGMCPYLSDEALKEWKAHKSYPLDADFMSWQRTDDNIDKNPYHDRFVCLTETLDLKQREDRYMLGRALYHIAQRRGFLSNRKDASDVQEGAVKKGIDELSVKMLEAGCEYIGEYFYKLYKNGGKIRTAYTDRITHLKREFDAICEKQQLNPEVVSRLNRAIFYQRPLKSQKNTVGKCSFEPNKARCQLSHPAFEEFRMWSFINNIKVKTYLDEDFRQLNEQEVDIIIPLFLRKSKPQFDFEDIAKKIAGKGNYAYRDECKEVGFYFNFRMFTNVSGCPVLSQIIDAFGTDYDGYLDAISEVYLKAEGKTQTEILNDLWHALVNFDSEDILTAWLSSNFQIEKVKAASLAKARIPQGYASLSLKAINNILPYLKRGFRYDEAVFMGNMGKVLKKAGEYSEESCRTAERHIIDSLYDYESNPLNRHTTKEAVICRSLQDSLNIPLSCSEHLYHPSMIETYKTDQPDPNGVIRLGSPRTSAIRNPMAMRSLFKLRLLINRLIDESKIDRDTKIHIEFARGLNDANMRAAISRYQRELEKQYSSYRKMIEDAVLEETGQKIVASDTDVLKYKLWEEQGRKCLYTGKSIAISDFIGDGNTFDIEHTIPRSREGDDSQMNKTLCENRFNREVKKGMIPSELSNHDEIMARIKALGWDERIEKLRTSIARQKRAAKSASTKEAKDAAIQTMHYLKMRLDYWEGKMSRFTMKSVPKGFSNRQGVDIGIIGKYAREYIRTVFPKVYAVKGSTTSDFRKMWGLQEEYSRKERVNHSHHCIDAITIACIGPKEYDDWARFTKDTEKYSFGNGSRPVVQKPWPTFTQDVKNISDELIVYHHHDDNLPKQNKKIWKVNGNIKTDSAGNPLYVQGDTARGPLHQDTFYGAINKDGEVKYVIRKNLDSIEDKDIKNIVDDVVRQKVRAAAEKYGNLKNAVAKGIWMNEEKGIPIRKVRLYAPTVTSPLHLKPQRDRSEKEYKQSYYVANDSNYCMAIYGDTKPSFILVNNLEAAKFFNGRTDKEKLIPDADKQGRRIKCLLKIGTMVLFYQDNKEEITNCSKHQLSKRLYEITGFSVNSIRQGERLYQYGLITLKHSLEARRTSELQVKKGAWSIDEEYRPIIALLHTQFKAMVQGFDFEMLEDGQIIFK